MRVGEITLTTSTGGGSPFQICQLTQLVDENQKVLALKCTFSDFKHNYNQRPFSLVIGRQIHFCPVQVLLDYLSRRGYSPGPLFILGDGSPVLEPPLQKSFPWPLSIVVLILLDIRGIVSV